MSKVHDPLMPIWTATPESIWGFSGAYRFLSNYYPSLIMGFDDDGVYPTVEHAYQATKTLSIEDRNIIRQLKSPSSAKFAGRRDIVLRPDWEEIKLDVMVELVRKKFQVPHLADQLRATGERELVEANHWGDRYWGVDRASGIGYNHLGLCLMVIRAVLP